MKKISLICTVYNEELTIELLLKAIAQQSLLPQEFIICDGDSTDSTQEKIKAFSQQHPKMHLKLLVKKGNRSVGRNAAIAAAKYELIAVTDAGCVPEKNWLEELLGKYEETDAPVVAGYYKGIPENSFQEAVIPYVLVMPDRVNETDFLPATRSVLFEKKVWEKLGGFDERLTLNEDYPFAKKMTAAGFSIAFAKKAVVGWLPRKNIGDFAVMIKRFAQGDAEAKIFRPKVVFIFIRYIVVLMSLTAIFHISNWKNTILFLIVLFLLYSIWAILKNRYYVKKGWYWLPVLQYVSDAAVMLGTLQGQKFLK